ncbi:peptidylprolyl isomerase [Streptomyces sp. AJS327]|uniref:peptidylprolyl isomerase n=1 Tax=Streptomyces sp. AJS327 TaxID=2545265 RepID=UPI0015DFAFA3|nr:peptidylprolyl isomerase [Streptomyces sp. AJS327]MBA0050800.1 peptidylprolyl isomerase [Streptomyces sp. AJS327]
MVSSEQRRKQLAKEKYLRQQERRAAARRRARLRNSGIACGVALVLAAGGAYAYSGGLNGDEEDDAAENAAAEQEPSKAPDPCDKPGEGKPKGGQWKKEPAMSIDRSADYAMSLDTTCGDIEIDLDAAKAPHTVNSFNFLAGKGYFDRTRCHRLVDSSIHVLQCGDPQGTGAGGPGYTIPDENLKSKKIKGNTYPAGTVAMANQYDPQSKKGKNSGGSQFFLVFKDSQLPPYYTPFGKITKGMDTLEKIAGAGTAMGPQGPTEAPNATVVIKKAEVGTS